VNGGRSFDVQLLVEDRLEQRLERRGGVIEAQREEPGAIDERAQLGIACAKMRDGFFRIERKFWAAAVVNHGWSVTHAPFVSLRAPCRSMLNLPRKGAFEQ